MRGLLWGFDLPQLWELVKNCQQKINQSKKEMENFIQAKLEGCNPGRASQKPLRTVPPVRSQNTVYISFLRHRAVHQMMYY